MELLLIIWTAGLFLWTFWLISASAGYHKANIQLQLDRVRWARHCEEWRRQKDYERN